MARTFFRFRPRDRRFNRGRAASTPAGPLRSAGEFVPLEGKKKREGPSFKGPGDNYPRGTHELALDDPPPGLDPRVAGRRPRRRAGASIRRPLRPRGGPAAGRRSAAPDDLDRPGGGTSLPDHRRREVATGLR